MNYDPIGDLTSLKLILRDPERTLRESVKKGNTNFTSGVVTVRKPVPVPQVTLASVG